MSEWVRSELRQLASFQKGRKVEVQKYPATGFAPYLGAAALSGAATEYAATHNAVMADPSHVLMLWDGERAGLVGKGQDGVVSSTVSRLTPHAEVDGAFLYYALDRKFDWIQGIRTGTGVPHVPKDIGRILHLDHPVDPVEQTRIAEVISSIDDAIAQTEELIAKTQQIKAGLMHDLFTRGVTKDGQLRPPREEAPYLYKESPLGWIPKEWEHGILNDIISPARPIVYGILMPGQGVPGGVPVIKVKDIIDGIVNDDDLLLTSQDIDEEYQRSKLKKGDILLTIRGTVGRLALVPPHLDQANITQDTARIGVVLGYPEFYRFYLETDQPRQYFAVNTLGVAVQGINLRDVRMTPVPIPQIIEQFSIAQRLKNAIETIRANEKSLGKLLNTKKGLMHDLLTGRVRVKTKSLPPTKSAHV